MTLTWDSNRIMQRVQMKTKNMLVKESSSRYTY